MASTKFQRAPALIDVSTILKCPLDQWNLWANEAIEANEYPPYGQPMAIATSTPDGFPSVRMVLLKGVDDRGFSFFTNYEGRKGKEIFSNPKVSFVIYWPTMGNEGRQVRVEGFVEKLSSHESDKYYDSRHIISRLGACCSRQSEVLLSREELEDKIIALEERIGSSHPPRPSNWGGFMVVPHTIEFWCNGFARLHDRVVYRNGPINKNQESPETVEDCDRPGSLSERKALSSSEWEIVRLNP